MAGSDDSLRVPLSKSGRERRKGRQREGKNGERLRFPNYCLSPLS